MKGNRIGIRHTLQYRTQPSICSDTYDWPKLIWAVLLRSYHTLHDDTVRRMDVIVQRSYHRRYRSSETLELCCSGGITAEHNIHHPRQRITPFAGKRLGKENEFVRRLAYNVSPWSVPPATFHLLPSASPKSSSFSGWPSEYAGLPLPLRPNFS